mmetsp:Transcript_58711/g.110757  ORF Transcript_58711/g.110757 Transcript_58711/m.110757 type:complete len:222 (-) Transcript_58711:384-1049(-)
MHACRMNDLMASKISEPSTARCAMSNTSSDAKNKLTARATPSFFATSRGWKLPKHTYSQRMLGLPSPNKVDSTPSTKRTKHTTRLPGGSTAECTQSTSMHSSCQVPHPPWSVSMNSSASSFARRLEALFTAKLGRLGVVEEEGGGGGSSKVPKGVAPTAAAAPVTALALVLPPPPGSLGEAGGDTDSNSPERGEANEAGLEIDLDRTGFVGLGKAAVAAPA